MHSARHTSSTREPPFTWPVSGWTRRRTGDNSFRGWRDTTRRARTWFTRTWTETLAGLVAASRRYVRTGMECCRFQATELTSGTDSSILGCCRGSSIRAKDSSPAQINTTFPMIIPIRMCQVEWTEPYRFNRVVDVLRSGDRFRLSDSERLQYDELSLPARDLVPFLDDLHCPDPNVERALGMLHEWDYVLSQDSIPAAIYEIWVNRLHPNVFSLYVPEQARALFGQGSRVVLTELLRS